MNNNLKFRIFNNASKIMFYPYQYKNGQLLLRMWDGMIVDVCEAERRGVLIENNRDNLIPLRYTGVNDKTGKEIYAGDIVRIELYEMHEKKEMMEGLWIVEDCIFEIALKPLQDVKAKIGIINKNSFKASIGHLCENDLLIVGNIYENKELLG